jgi:Fe-S cluster assembly ATP-binding protein
LPAVTINTTHNRKKRRSLMAETAKSDETDQSQSRTQSSKAADRREEEALDAKDSADRRDSTGSRPILEIVGLHAGVEGKEILKGIDLALHRGEVQAIMGPNGSGKSTLASVIAGKPAYEVYKGRIILDGQDITDWSPDERGRAGLFLAFQYPEEIPGVTMVQLLRAALSQRRGENLAAFEARLILQDALRDLEMDPSFADRYVNEGFSGGEKKRAEILQLAVLEPTVAILDETDSGLDIDALKIVASGIAKVRERQPSMAVLLITHYQRILRYIQPDLVHVLVDGKIVESGGKELAERLEREGYERYLAKPAGVTA